ncbi:ankyrin repeat-containing domain protein [Lactarius hengduanensis]|nr:ankyrin repeat-containing domain protein [Lactarius hengduanensis]
MVQNWTLWMSTAGLRCTSYHKANATPRKPPLQQSTPLHVASFNGKLEIARFLLDNGAHVDGVDEYGKTPLHVVSQGKCDSKEAAVGVARLLLERGGGVNRLNKKQRTPLHIALYNGKPEIARFLLDNGAAVDAVDVDGRTPLHFVSRGKYDSEEAAVGVARLLLERGADANAKAKSGKTPLELVSDSWPKLAQLLRDHGARPRESSSWTGLFKSISILSTDLEMYWVYWSQYASTPVRGTGAMWASPKQAG